MIFNPTLLDAAPSLAMHWKFFLSILSYSADCSSILHFLDVAPSLITMPGEFFV